MSESPPCPLAESGECENDRGGYTREADPEVHPAPYLCALCGAYFSNGGGGATVVGP